VRIRVDPPSHLSDLRWHFERSGFAVRELAPDAIWVERRTASSDAEAAHEIELHLRVWTVMRPEAQVTLSRD
jgi:hypothetical protein